MWAALGDLAVTLEAMADGRCPAKFYLSSLDPGVGKTQTIAHFIRELLTSKDHSNVAVVVCVSRLEEIRAFVATIGLPEEQYAVFTRDDAEGGVNELGSQKPSRARVLFTTQQMIERRCAQCGFEAAQVFHYQGRPRQVRIWDETILPGQTLTLNRDDIAFLFKPLRGRFPALTEDLDAMFTQLATVKDGAFFDVLPFAEKHAVDVNDVLRILESESADWRAAASALWLLSGKRAVVRRDGYLGNTLLDYRETLPEDLAPMVVLDASGRVRNTYAQWVHSRGNLVRLRTATKSYRNLTVHVWQRSGGKSAFANEGGLLADGIASTINGKPDEEWLVVCHQPRPGSYDVEASVRDLLSSDAQRVHFITWGNHHATNKYSHIRNVILAGTLFYRQSHYESLGRLASGMRPSDGRYPRDTLDAVVAGEHAHLVLQALCRGAVRLCDGDRCQPCDAYVIASVRSGIPQALKTIFPHCRSVRWSPVQRALKGKVRDAYDFIAKHFEDGKGAFLRFNDVMRSIGMANAANFRSNVRRHPDFVEAVAEIGVVEHGEGIYPRGFMRIADVLGFQDESGYSTPS